MDKSINYSKCVNIATYPIIDILTYYYRSYFPSFSVALPRHKIKFKLNRPGSMLTIVFFKGRSFSGLRDLGLLALQRRNCEKSFPFAQVTVLAKVRNTFRPYPHESGQAETRFQSSTKKIKQNTL